MTDRFRLTSQLAILQEVAIDYQGKTIGRQMMAWALEYGQEKGALFAQLTTHKSRMDAKRFYETLGFEATHVGMKRFFQKQ